VRYFRLCSSWSPPALATLRSARLAEGVWAASGSLAQKNKACLGLSWPRQGCPRGGLEAQRLPASDLMSDSVNNT
jgi:hypothetical protein